jgi:hypothetical protein
VLRPLSLGELLDRTFTLYRRHFLLFIGLAALPSLLTLAVQSLVRTSTTPLAGFVGVMAQFLVSFVVSAIIGAATVHAVSELYLDRPTSISAAFRAAMPHLVKLAILSLLIGIIVGLGFLLLIVPGIILALRYSLATPVAVIEDATIQGAMSRSAELASGAWPRILAIYCMFVFLSLAMGMLLAIPGIVAAAMSGAFNAETALLPGFLTDLAGYVGGVLVTPLMTIAIALLYFDQRVRKEAFDLEHMMTKLDVGASGSGAIS